MVYRVVLKGLSRKDQPHNGFIIFADTLDSLTAVHRY